MKYLHLTLVALLVVSLFSCSKNEDSPKPSEQLVGKWRMTSFTYTGSSTTNYGGESTTAPFSGTGKDMDAHISFASNPNTYTSTGDYTIELTMDMGGEKITQDYPVQDFMGSGSWSRTGNKVTITDKATGKSAPATILQLDDNTLKIQWGGNLATANSAEMPVTVTVNGTYVFERE